MLMRAMGIGALSRVYKIFMKFWTYSRNVRFSCNTLSL